MGSFAVAVKHHRIVILEKKWVKLNQQEKLLENIKREKALISKREEKFPQALSLTRFCPRHVLSFS